MTRVKPGFSNITCLKHNYDYAVGFQDQSMIFTLFSFVFSVKDSLILSASLFKTVSFGHLSEVIVSVILSEADNWISLKPDPVGPLLRSQTPFSSEDAPRGPR